MPAGARRKIDFVGDAQGAQFFMQPVVAPEPILVVWINDEKYVRRMVSRTDMKDRCILPAVFLAVVHLIQRGASAVPIMVVERRGNSPHRGEPVRKPEGQPQGSLAAHADAAETDRPRTDAPAGLKSGPHMVQKMPLGSPLRIELRTDAVGPPAPLAMGTDAGHSQLVQHASEGRPAAQRLQVPAMQKEQAKPRL